MKKRTVSVLLALIALNLAFIWGNSMLPAAQSKAVSGGTLAWLVVHFPLLEGMGEYLLRKLGHLSEFACLGMLLLALFQQLEQSLLHRYSMAVFCGLLAALTDETIQVVTPGRGPLVTDIWIDLGGICAGFLLLLLSQRVLRTISERKQTK